MPHARARRYSSLLDFAHARIQKTSVKLSSKGRYGVRALFHIAFHNGGRATQMREIADRERIPLRFLEQIFHDLKRAGIVVAKRGPRGGYHLARPPKAIRLGDVIRALDGTIAVVSRGDEPDCGSVSEDPIASVFSDIAHRIERCFDEVTLAEVCDRGETLGLRRARPVEDYAI
jgi:Rrf2 family iron-sulfur cluster assembly transcriptional regulator